VPEWGFHCVLGGLGSKGLLVWMGEADVVSVCGSRGNLVRFVGFWCCRALMVRSLSQRKLMVLSLFRGVGE